MAVFTEEDYYLNLGCLQSLTRSQSLSIHEHLIRNVIYWLPIDNNPLRDRHKTKLRKFLVGVTRSISLKAPGCTEKRSFGVAVIGASRHWRINFLSGTKLKDNFVGESFCDTFCVKSIKRHEYRRYSKTIQQAQWLQVLVAV